MEKNANPAYNAELALHLGADTFGMKTYVLVMLMSGSADNQDQEFVEQAFKGHFENIHRLVAEGKLVVVGPFHGNERGYRGLFIFDVATFDEVRELLHADPTIAGGIFTAELYHWYGSAALPAYLTVADTIWQEKP